MVFQWILRVDVATVKKYDDKRKLGMREHLVEWENVQEYV
jgi:hypothetical protein